MILGGEKSTDQSVTQQVADYIIGHVSNSDKKEPIINFAEIFLGKEEPRICPNSDCNSNL